MSSLKHVVALAGVKTIGLHALDAIIASLNWTPLILCRRGSPNPRPGVAAAEVNYSDVEGLTHILKEHKVEAVISFIQALVEPKVHVGIHTSLIKASEEAGVKRLVPSEWAGDLEKYPDLFRLYDPKLPVRDLLAESKLEYTLVANGLFMDYLLPRGKKQYLTGLTGLPVSPEDRIARIPGDGNAPITLTTGTDVGRGVVWLLDQPHWDKHTYLRGEDTTWNKVLREAEEIVGEKFKEEYVSLERVDQGIKDAESDGNPTKLFFAQVEGAYARGQLAIPEGGFEKAERRTSVKELLKSGYP